MILIKCKIVSPLANINVLVSLNKVSIVQTTIGSTSLTLLWCKIYHQFHISDTFNCQARWGAVVWWAYSSRKKSHGIKGRRFETSQFSLSFFEFQLDASVPWVQSSIAWESCEQDRVRRLTKGGEKKAGAVIDWFLKVECSKKHTKERFFRTYKSD